MTDETNPLAIGQTSAATTTSEPVQNQVEEVEDGPIDIDEVQGETTEANDAAEGALEKPEGAEPEVETAETTDENDPFAGYEEIDFDGKAFKVPAELKDGYLRQADYTRKTQAVAEKERELQAKAAEVAQRSQMADGEFQAKVAMLNVKDELEQFANVNWHELNAINPQDDPIGFMEAQQKWSRYQYLNGVYGQAEQILQQATQQRTQAAEQDFANRMRATGEFAKREIKGWTPEIDQQVTQFAVQDLKFSDEALKSALNPQIYQTLYLAWLGRQTLTRQQTAKPAPAVVAPTQTVSAKGNAVVQKDPGDMSEAEYMAYREAQIARRKK